MDQLGGLGRGERGFLLVTQFLFLFLAQNKMSHMPRERQGKLPFASLNLDQLLVDTGIRSGIQLFSLRLRKSLRDGGSVAVDTKVKSDSRYPPLFENFSDRFPTEDYSNTAPPDSPPTSHLRNRHQVQGKTLATNITALLFSHVFTTVCPFFVKQKLRNQMSPCSSLRLWF